MGENEAEKPSNELFRSLPGALRHCRVLALEEMVISRELDATNDKGESRKKSSLPSKKRNCCFLGNPTKSGATRKIRIWFPKAKSMKISFENNEEHHNVQERWIFP